MFYDQCLFWTILASSWSLLKLSWAILGASLGPSWSYWGLARPPWGGSGAPRGQQGAMMNNLGLVLDQPGPSCGHLGANKISLEALLVRSWGGPRGLSGPTLWHFGALLDRLGPSMNAFSLKQHKASASWTMSVHIVSRLTSPTCFPVLPRVLEASSPRGASAGTRSTYNMYYIA